MAPERDGNFQISASLSLGCFRVIDGEKSKLVSGSKAESVGSTHFSMRAETWEIYSKRFAVVKHNRKFHPSPLMSVPKGGGSHAPCAKKLLWLWIKFAHIFLSRICLRLGYCFFMKICVPLNKSCEVRNDSNTFKDFVVNFAAYLNKALLDRETP